LRQLTRYRGYGIAVRTVICKLELTSLHSVTMDHLIARALGRCFVACVHRLRAA
jgi:hypothetical protein